jgi:hypothetical protein
MITGGVKLACLDRGDGLMPQRHLPPFPAGVAMGQQEAFERIVNGREPLFYCSRPCIARGVGIRLGPSWNYVDTSLNRQTPAGQTRRTGA